MRLWKYSRAAELAAVERTLRAAASGQGGTVLIRGEAGIGKTELIERALDRAAGLWRLRAGWREFETELPFTGLHDLSPAAAPVAGDAARPTANRSGSGVRTAGGHDAGPLPGRPGGARPAVGRRP